ncbi:Ribonuclease 3 [Tripterygium wilfordii]|uniref:Ribonuclease 3 n=1 Tax=Tripterygium wilfordii TaxID=458696 RepID=A0A7J7CJE3_TRIWF|nr:protein NUCLEAR FUSION DEFECTIVE 2 [Tripterygium wilfordii]KAF5734185.1 Ribonuclease 3 [Tripterygium wilfordii]
MKEMHFRRFTVLIVLVFTVTSLSLVHASSKHQRRGIDINSPFDTALETLQKQIRYNFKKIDLLRRAMTHPSFSEENNKALSVLGADVIDSSISLRFLQKNIDMSSKDLNERKLEISKQSSCAVDGTRLGLHKVVRVSPKTNSTAPAVVCGAFRAIFGAIAIDIGKSDDAGGVFWDVHSGDVGQALAL